MLKTTGVFRKYTEVSLSFMFKKFPEMTYSDRTPALARILNVRVGQVEQNVSEHRRRLGDALALDALVVEARVGRHDLLLRREQRLLVLLALLRLGRPRERRSRLPIVRPLVAVAPAVVVALVLVLVVEQVLVLRLAVREPRVIIVLVVVELAARVRLGGYFFGVGAAGGEVEQVRADGRPVLQVSGRC